MNLLIRILMFAAAAGAITALAAYMASYRESMRAGKRLTEVLDRMETGYTNFMRRYTTHEILSIDDFDSFSNALVSDVMPVLEPHLNALVAGINSNSRKQIPIRPKSELFASVAATAEWLNQLGKENRSPLTLEQEKQLRASVEVAIRADLIRRKMNLSAGNL